MKHDPRAIEVYNNLKKQAKKQKRDYAICWFITGEPGIMSTRIDLDKAKMNEELDKLTARMKYVFKFCWFVETKEGGGSGAYRLSFKPDDTPHPSQVL